MKFWFLTKIRKVFSPNFQRLKIQNETWDIRRGCHRSWKFGLKGKKILSFLIYFHLWWGRQSFSFGIFKIFHNHIYRDTMIDVVVVFLGLQLDLGKMVVDGEWLVATVILAISISFLIVLKVHHWRKLWSRFVKVDVQTHPFVL